MSEMESSLSPIINVGIIGAGYGLTSLLPVLASIPEYKGIFVGKNSDFRANTEIESRILKGAIFISPNDIISNSDIQLVVIASPPSTHEEYALAALDAGKNIYCEKPVGLNSNSTRRIMQASKKTNLISTVGYQFRYDPMIEWLKAQRASGELGDVNRVEIRWETSGAIRTPATSWRNELKQGGGVLRDFGSHVFDYLSFVDPINFPQILDESEVHHRFKNNMYSQDIQNVDFSGIFGSIELHCIISRTRSHPIGHDIRVIGSKAEARVTHKSPFGIEDLKLKIVMKSGLHKDITQDAGPDPTPSGLSAHKLDGRQLSSRRLFVELAHAIRGKTSDRLPTFQQALLNQNLVDAVESFLFSD